MFKFIRYVLEKFHIIHSGIWSYSSEDGVYYRTCAKCGEVQAKEYL